MSNNYVEVDNFTPTGGLSNPQRSLSGIVEAGAVTYDTDYGSGVYARWLYVGTTGSVSVKLINGNTVTLPNVAAGVWMPIWSVQVASSGTTVAANQLFWGN